MGLHVRSASGSWLMAGVRDKIEVQVEELKKKNKGIKSKKTRVESQSKTEFNTYIRAAGKFTAKGKTRDGPVI